MKLNNLAEYNRDQFGRPDLSFEQYSYDKVGNRTSVRLADGNTNTYQYDPLNRLRQLTYLDGQM